MTAAISTPLPCSLPLDVGPRAPFFGPGPIAVGTAAVESLASYVLRLAVCHRVTLYNFLKSRPPDLAPCFIEAASAIGTRYDTEIRSGGVNGSPQGAIIARALATLTGRPAVAWTTFSAYNGHAGTRRFLHHRLRWCPKCLAEDAEPYERLLWNARLLTVCPHHQVRLISVCPHCGWRGARQIVQAWLFLCRRCRRPLFTCGRITNEPSPSPAEIGESLSVAQFCQALFERSIDLKKHNLIADLCRVAEKHDANSVIRKADFLGVSKGSLSEWLNEWSYLTLVRYIEICSSLGIAPLQPLLEADVRTSIAQNGPNKIRSRFWNSSRHRKCRPDKATLKSRLLDVHEQHPTMGVGEIARKIGHERTKFFHWFPGLCHSITDQARNARREHRLRKLDGVKDEIASIIQTLVAEGVRPTMRNVAGQMKTPGWFRSAEIRAHREEVLAGLNEPPAMQPTVPIERAC